MIDENKVKNIKLRKLKSLLIRIFNEQLIVVNWSTKNMLQPGENYANTIFNVHVIIKRDNKAEKENLHLVAKMPAKTVRQQRKIDSPSAFKKEIFMYENIISHYNDLEREAGFEENEIFDILPKYYNSRLSLNPNIDFDDDAVILMENLKIRGYYICDVHQGCDFEHSRITVQAMARFHALGIVSKYKRPEYFEVIKQRSKCLKYEFDMSNNYQSILKTIEEDPQIADYYYPCKMTMYRQDLPIDETWSTIIHADFWVNNIMFHRDENGQVDNIKFVDFQNYLFLSPLREIIFYLFCNTTIIDCDIKHLIDLYHNTFLATLKRMNCNAKSFNREEFDKRLNIDANFEFLHVIIMLHILLKKETFIERLRKVVIYFVQQNWLDTMK